MANIKSKKKNIRKIAKQTVHNRKVRSTLKTLNKKVASAETPEAKKEAAQEFVSALDKAAKVGIIHSNKASRNKSKVAKFLAAA